MNESREISEVRAETPVAPRQTRRVVHVPRVDVRETADAFHVVADLPGVDPNGVSVTVEKDVLSIAAQAKRGAFEGYRRVYGQIPATDYRRVFTLGEKVDRDGIAASLKNGTLRVTVPKAREAVPRKIAIQAA